MSQSTRRLQDVQEAFHMTPQPLQKSQKTLGFAFLSAEAKEEQAKKQLEEDCKSLAQSWGLYFQTLDRHPAKRRSACQVDFMRYGLV